MRMPAYLEIPRGLFVTVFSAAMGSASSTLLLSLIFRPEAISVRGPALQLVSGLLGFMPFTLFGSIAVLLPTYLWFRDKGGSRKEVYRAVILGGAGGAMLIMLILVIALGGLTAGRIPAQLLGMGVTVGVTTAIWWIAAHHLTRSRRAEQNGG